MALPDDRFLTEEFQEKLKQNYFSLGNMNFQMEIPDDKKWIISDKPGGYRVYKPPVNPTWVEDPGLDEWARGFLTQVEDKVFYDLEHRGEVAPNSPIMDTLREKASIFDGRSSVVVVVQDKPPYEIQSIIRSSFRKGEGDLRRLPTERVLNFDLPAVATEIKTFAIDDHHDNSGGLLPDAMPRHAPEYLYTRPVGDWLEMKNYNRSEQALEDWVPEMMSIGESLGFFSTGREVSVEETSRLVDKSEKDARYVRDRGEMRRALRQWSGKAPEVRDLGHTLVTDVVLECNPKFGRLYASKRMGSFQKMAEHSDDKVWVMRSTRQQVVKALREQRPKVGDLRIGDNLNRYFLNPYALFRGVIPAGGVAAHSCQADFAKLITGK